MVTKAFVGAMIRRNINPQKYWNGTLAGPDTRRFPEGHHVEILRAVKSAIIANSTSPEVDSAFYDRHCAVLKPLASVNRFGRKNALLSQGEFSYLRATWKAYAAVELAACPKREHPTAKSHIAERS